MLLGGALFLGALPGGGVLASAACAAESPSAALVVDTGEGVTSLCVALPADSVSGMKLIQLAGQQHGLQYRIEGGAVCQLAGTGPSQGDCFGEYPDFWGYWRGDDDGGWTWSNSGAATTSVSAGDVEGWAWGSGNDGTSHPQPPASRHSEVCDSASSGGEKPEPEDDGAGSDREDHEGAPEPGSDEGEENDDPTATTEGSIENDDGVSDGATSEAEGERRRKGKRRAGADSATDDDLTEGSERAPADEDEPGLAPALSTGDEATGPPAVGLAALGAALLLGGAGVLAARRRRSR